jgi:hypothetical protein
LLPRSRGLPRAGGGSASISSLSRPARTSLALRPVGLLDRPRRPLSRGSGPAGRPAKPLVSYQINRQLSGWNPPPLATRAVGAHPRIGNGEIGQPPGWSGVAVGGTLGRDQPVARSNRGAIRLRRVHIDIVAMGIVGLKEAGGIPFRPQRKAKRLSGPAYSTGPLNATPRLLSPCRYRFPNVFVGKG